MCLAEGTVPREGTVAARAWPPTQVGHGQLVARVGPGPGSVELDADSRVWVCKDQSRNVLAAFPFLANRPRAPPPGPSWTGGMGE